MKLRKLLVGILLGSALGFTGIVAPMPGNHEVAEAAWSQSRADKVINTGKQYLGTPYKFGSKAARLARLTARHLCSEFTRKP